LHPTWKHQAGHVDVIREVIEFSLKVREKVTNSHKGPGMNGKQRERESSSF
jgi:hypothetical protein